MVYCQLDKKKETTNPYDMDIKDEIVLKGMPWAASYEIEYNTIGSFKTINSNTPGYYIFLWTGNAYTLK